MKEAFVLRIFRIYIKAVGKLNNFVGGLISILPLAITVLSALEVAMRYIFEKPTIWVWDLNIQLFAALVMLGGGYTLLHKGHISVDFFTAKLSPKKKALLDLITSGFFFFSIIILLFYGWEIAWDSWVKRETMATLWAPPLYTMKMTIPVGALLILLQGIAKYLADFILLVKGEEVLLHE
jgi:TRAP-type mannitol/chloroaromatic compound transport system permease small subunit